MSRQITRGALVLISFIILATSGTIPGAHAQQVWSGRRHAFVKADNADWTLPENQDRITEAVWLTRKDTQGIFNIAQEDTYVPGSPADTEWATGDAADWPNLEFTHWVGWVAGFPPGVVGVDAVLHLISEDIYIDIRFESWTGSNLGGGFSYYRAVPPVVPAERGSWGRIKALYR